MLLALLVVLPSVARVAPRATRPRPPPAAPTTSKPVSKAQRGGKPMQSTVLQ